MSRSNTTKKQHYVPQVYLKGFSGDQKHIWRYHLDPFDAGKLVPIESVCRRNYLYEIRDNTGGLERTNWIENVLAQFEGRYATYLRDLERKAFHEANFKTKCFLNSNEKLFWKLYVAVQIMRTPEVINTANAVVKDFFDKQLSKDEQYMVALSQCLPFFNQLKEEDKNVFSVFLKPLLGMSIAIGVDLEGTLYTSDNPVYCYVPPYEDFAQINEYEEVIMPLTTKLVLILLGGEKKKEYDKNRLFHLEADDLKGVKSSVAYTANVQLFSQNKLAKEDVALITQVRNDKEKDKNQIRG